MNYWIATALSDKLLELRDHIAAKYHPIVISDAAWAVGQYLDGISPLRVINYFDTVKTHICDLLDIYAKNDPQSPQDAF